MRRVPPALLAHLQQPVTTTCRLLQIRLSDDRRFGLTTLDQDVEYLGVTYSALNGFDSSIIATDTGMSVDNAEAEALVSATVDGITAEMARRGDLDNAKWQMMLVNWADLSMGHVTLDAGDLGEVKVTDDVIYVAELLSFTARLRQAIGLSWSRRCRAEFGSPANSQTGCGVDADALWVSATVTGVSVDDAFRLFSATALVGHPKGFPGRVRWTSGSNAGHRLWQVEAFSSASGTVALFEAMPYAIEAGDGLEFRADCNKSPSDCTFYGNFINYKGEPYIPVGDGLESMTPGAQVFGGLSGSEIID